MRKFLTFTILTAFAGGGPSPAADPAAALALAVALPQSTLPAKCDCLCSGDCTCPPGECRCGRPTLALAAVVDPLAEQPRQAPPPPQPGPTPDVQPLPATVVVSGCGPGTVLTVDGTSVYGVGGTRTITTPPISATGHYIMSASTWEGAGRTITGAVNVYPGKVTTVTIDWAAGKLVIAVGDAPARRVVGYRQECTGSGCRVVAIYEGSGSCAGGCANCPNGSCVNGECGVSGCGTGYGGACASGSCSSGSCSSESAGGSCGLGVGRPRIFHRLFHPFRGRSRRGGCSSCG